MPIEPLSFSLCDFLCCLLSQPGDGQVGFEEFVTLLGPKLASAGMPDKFHGADFDSVFWKVRSAAALIFSPAQQQDR